MATVDINGLHEELLVYIFQYLPVDALLSCELVCERWKMLINEPAVWRNVELIYCHDDHDEAMKTLSIIKSHPEQIRRLEINNVRNYTTLKSLFKSCINLISLALYNCKVCKPFENDIIKLTKLRKLLLEPVSKNCDSLVIQFDKFTDLKILALASWGLNSKNCYTLLQCCHLRHIFLDDVEGLDVEFVKLLISSRKDILKELHLYGGSSVDDRVLQLLSQCPQLVYLGISDCSHLSDEGLLFLTSMKRIKIIQLINNNNFSESALLKVFGNSALLTLQILSLHCITNLTVTALRHIRRHLRLHLLDARPHIDFD